MSLLDKRITFFFTFLTNLVMDDDKRLLIGPTNLMLLRIFHLYR